MSTSDNSFADLVKRLNAMSNLTPEEERASLMESVGKAPKVLDDKEVTLSDIAKLAGIKEYVEPVKHSKKAEALVESITAPQSSISKAIAESDADDSIATSIKKEVNEEVNRLDKIAELEAQLAELKTEQKEEQTYDSKSFREVITKDIAEYIKGAEDSALVELYNTISDNEAVYNEESSNILIKTPETTEIIADAEQAEAPEEEVVAEKEDEGQEHTHEDGTTHTHKGGDKEHQHDEEQPVEEEMGEEVELEAEASAEDKFTNDLDPADKK